MALQAHQHITILAQEGVNQVLRRTETDFLALADKFNSIAPQEQKVLTVPKDPKKRAALTKKMMSHLTAHEESQCAPSA